MHTHIYVHIYLIMAPGSWADQKRMARDVNICIFTYMNIHMYVCICIYTYIHRHIHVYIYTCIRSYAYIFYIIMAPGSWADQTRMARDVNICIFTYMNILMYVCICIYTYTHRNIHIYIHTYIHVYTYIFTYLFSRLLGRHKANGQKWFLIQKHTRDLFLVCPPRLYNWILVEFLQSRPVITLRTYRMSFAMNLKNWIVFGGPTSIIQLSTTTHYNILQHTVTHCNAHTSWTHTPRLLTTAPHCTTLQHTASHCNTLQHTATHCNTLQRTATHCNTIQRW